MSVAQLINEIKEIFHGRGNDFLTPRGSSIFRGSNPGTSFPGWSARVLVESRG